MRGLVTWSARWLVAIAAAIAPGMAWAQGATLHGALVDSLTRAPVANARLSLIALADSSDRHDAISGDDGAFRFTALALRPYRLEAAPLGYRPLRRMVSVSLADQDLHAIALAPAALELAPVTVKAIERPAVQRADTTEFSARAFKTHPDATAEDLIRKMPGITVTNGTVTSNGETVQQVLVDGRPYFGGDPTIAMRNLPATVIDKIQVFDKLSDQSEFTGFDDGQSQKTINLVPRPEARNSHFGKASGGGGTDSRYSAGGDVNVLKGADRVSVIGLMNNVNQQNFGAQDLLGVLETPSRRAPGGGGPNGGGTGGGGRGGSGGGGGRGGGGGGFGRGAQPGAIGAGTFLVGQQDGVTTTQSLGLNQSWARGREMGIDQSFFYNEGDNFNVPSLTRAYFNPIDSIARYDQSATNRNLNHNYRYDGRIEFGGFAGGGGFGRGPGGFGGGPGGFGGGGFGGGGAAGTSWLDRPRLYFQDNRSSSDLTASNTSLAGEPFSRTENDNSGSTSGNNLSNHLVMRHRFATRGRTLSIDFGLGHTLKQGGSLAHSLASYGDTAAVDTVDQRGVIHTTTSSVSARSAWTEPLPANAQLQFSYTPSWTGSDADNRASLYDPISGGFTLPDTTHSNVFHSTTSAQNGALSVQMRRRTVSVQAEVALQTSALTAEQSFPAQGTVSRDFFNLLPAMNLNWNLTRHRNLRMWFHTTMRVPTIAQLQNVVDNSNPLVLTTGNPLLRPTYDMTGLLRYSTTDTASGRGIFLLASVTKTRDYIGNATFTATSDTVVPVGIVLRSGTQLVRPVNLGESWNARSFLTYSRPVRWLRSVGNLNGGVTYVTTPGLVNLEPNTAKTWTLSAGAVLASNISEKVDFNLSYNGSYNIARNDHITSLDNEYYSHTAGLELNVIARERWVIRNELNHTIQGGLSAGYNTHVLLWNASLARKLFASRAGEIRLSGYDLLDQNKSTTRSVSEGYVEDARSTTLGRYVLLAFTWTIR